ncbi:MAG: DHH family phosphoesterase [Fibrobacterota bacterium]
MILNNTASFFELAEQAHSFCISSHISQDADNIGSQLALYWYLKSLGKDVEIYNADPVPSKFSFLSGSGDITSVEPAKKFDVLVIVDSSNPSRLGWENAPKAARKIINIDHHRDNSHFGDVNIVSTDAAATCQIIARLFEENSISYPPAVADALYAGLLADTGGFQFENTTAELLRDAATVIDRGADNTGVYKRLFANKSVNALRLRSEVWGTLAFYGENRIAVMTLDRNRIDELGADNGDTEGLADMAKNGDGVEVAMLLKYDASVIHCSLRSSGRVDVGAIAATIPGGGGHSCAAGCDITGKPLSQAREMIINMVKEAL